MTTSKFAWRKTRIRDLPAWKLEDAKAKFSEVVRRARSEGPQRVTHRRRDAVVVMDVDDLRTLLEAKGRHEDLVTFLRGSALAEVDVTRACDRGRVQDL